MNDWQKSASIAICIGATAIALYFAVKYAFGIFLPFFIAWCVAMLIDPLAKRVSERAHIPRKLCAVALVAVLLSICGILICIAANRLIYEIERLIRLIGENSEVIERELLKLVDYVEGLGSKLPFLDNDRLGIFKEELDGILVDMFKSAVESVSSNIPGMIANTVKKLPGFVIFVTVLVIACFYFAADIKKINRALGDVLPSGISSKISNFKGNIKRAAVAYVRGYLLLLLLTFAELFAGLSILGVEYAMLLAVIIALIDILPVLGVGVVLAPWAAIMLFLGNSRMGIGLLVLWGSMAVIRQIAEPKIIGESIGLPPLVMLIAMYVGLELFGLVGVILGPFAALVITAFCRARIERARAVRGDNGTEKIYPDRK